MGKKYNLCNYDEKEEYNLYSKIDMGSHKESNYMKELKGCTPVDKYAAWKEHIIKDFCENDPERYYFLHYMKKTITNYQKFEEGLKTLVIPFYLTLVTIILTINLDKDISKGELIGMVAAIFVALVIVVIICSVQIKNNKNKILFCEEFIEVIKNAKASHQ